MSTGVSLSAFVYSIWLTEEETHGMGQYIGYAYFIPMIYFYCSPLGPLISWLNYSLLLHCVVMEVQMYEVKCDILLQQRYAFSLFEIICHDVKMKVC